MTNKGIRCSIVLTPGCVLVWSVPARTVLRTLAVGPEGCRALFFHRVAGGNAEERGDSAGGGDGGGEDCGRPRASVALLAADSDVLKVWRCAGLTALKATSAPSAPGAPGADDAVSVEQCGGTVPFPGGVGPLLPLPLPERGPGWGGAVQASP